MTRALTIYVADDGSRWDSAEDAVKRDILDRKVREIEASFPKPPDDSNERIKVGPDTAEAKRAVVELCRALYPNEAVFKHPPEEIHPFSYAGRFLSEVGGPLNRVWWRFSCIGEDGYMYQQPFYASNPHKFREFAKP